MKRDLKQIADLCNALNFALSIADKKATGDYEDQYGLHLAHGTLYDAREYLARRQAFWRGFQRGLALYIPDLITWVKSKFQSR